MALYKNKYRIESARWHNWNYANAAAYYVTICTKDRAHFFGTCVRERMCLNEIGALAWQFWQEIPQHFPHVQLDQFVIMPNHVHGIIIIQPSPVETLHCNVSTITHCNVSAIKQCSVSTSQTNNFNQKMSEISPKSGSLSTIIRSYKSACSKHIRLQFPEAKFAWQSRFHDRVIRNEQEYYAIANYIHDNPKNWNKDELYISSP